MNDFDQLRVFGQRTSDLTEMTRLQRELEALQVEQKRTAEKLESALAALDKIANMPVITISMALDERDAWQKLTMKLRDVARHALECGGQEKAEEIPPFLTDARRRKMRRIWEDVHGR